MHLFVLQMMNADQITLTFYPEVVCKWKSLQFVREGILSELVIFGDKLFANVAGPKEDAETLYSILAAAGEVETSRGSWRESGF